MKIPESQPSRLPRLLSIPHVAEHLGVCTKTVRRFIGAGALPTIRVGRTICIAEGDLAAHSARVFASADSSHKRSPVLSHQIKGRVGERCGIDLSAHLFRHLAAKLYLEAFPGACGLVRMLLGHKNIGTTTGRIAGPSSPRPSGCSMPTSPSYGLTGRAKVFRVEGGCNAHAQSCQSRLPARHAFGCLAGF